VRTIINERGSWTGTASDLFGGNRPDGLLLALDADGSPRFSVSAFRSWSSFAGAVF
jgi:hypothetical protein